MNHNIFYLGLAALVEGILLCVYNSGVNLPINKNRLYHRILVLILSASFINLSTILLQMVFTPEIAYIIYGLKTIYFIIYNLVFLISFQYGMEYINRWDKYKSLEAMYVCPFALICLIIISSVNKHTLYHYTACGTFMRGPFYNIVNISPWVYALLLAGTRPQLKEKQSKSEFSISVFLFLAILCGVTLDSYYENTYLIDTFFSIVAVIMFLKLENPEQFIYYKTNSFNLKGFSTVIDEYMHKNKSFSCIGFKISNYEALNRHYGFINVTTGFSSLSQWLSETFPNSYNFYLDNQCFLLISEKDIDTDDFTEMLEKRTERPFGSDHVELFIRCTPFYCPDPYIFDNADELMACLIFGMKNSSIKKNGILEINTEVYQKMSRNNELHSVIQDKIQKKDIDVYFQPLYSTKEKKITGAEALARIIDDEKGIIMPGDFIPIAEETGEIIPLGKIVFENICKYIASHRLEIMGLDFININVSPVQFQDSNLISGFKKIADSYNIDFSIFDFEITETGMAQDTLIDYHIDIINKSGASISLDDFGKGNSNLERLMTYPFSIAKLDMFLVWNYFDGKSLVMEDVIRMFKNKNLSIVAEGVEDQTMVDRLSELSCEYLQGYYFSKPLPQNEFDSYIIKFNKVKDDIYNSDYVKTPLPPIEPNKVTIEE